MDQLAQTPVTLSGLIISNLIMLLPVYILVARGVWYIAQMAQRVDLMWKSYTTTQMHNGRRAYDPRGEEA